MYGAVVQLNGGKDLGKALETDMLAFALLSAIKNSSVEF